MLPLVDTEKVMSVLKEVLENNKDKYLIVQSECDIGVAEMTTMHEPHQYNKVHIALTFLDKSKMPSAAQISEG